MIHLTFDPVTSILLAWLLKKVLEHDRLLAVFKNDCPKVKGAKEECV